ncbi:AEC family transporter [Egbenema bharatensis]|uniref:AEC family transporter n=1 Tax=Egbenema bharatensis TaxID=3463334 RepID=UPI003A876761
MTDILLHAYLPLFAWTGLGIVLIRFLPDALPRFLGRSLYWVGVPLEILALTRRSQFSLQAGVVPMVAVGVLLVGLLLSWLTLQLLEVFHARQPDACAPETQLALSHSRFPTPPASRPTQGSFILSSILANTGFVGLAVVPAFVSAPYLSWVVLYSVTHNILGSYGIGVVIASYFGRAESPDRGWRQLRDVVTVPSLWAFCLGSTTQSIALPTVLEQGLQASIWVVIPAALLLMGMRISQLQGWKSLQMAVIPAGFKAILLPGLVGIVTTLAGITGDARLALVLMAGMPTAFAGLILAEEYELDRELIASSIVLTSGLLVLTIPLGLFLLS